MTPLSDLAIGQKAKIVRFETNKKTLMYFMKMGLRINDQIQMLGQLPLGGNILILSSHGKYTLRKKTAQFIKIIKIY